MLRDYLIRLTREYTDGGMDSHAEEEKGATQGKMQAAVIKSSYFKTLRRRFIASSTFSRLLNALIRIYP